MTLVVGAIDQGTVTITSDSKVSYDEDGLKTARLFDEALPKVVLLRDNLAVGVAGPGPARMIEDLVKHRDADLLDVLEHLRSERDGAFVVGALTPARLWEVSAGRVTAIPSGQYAWAGDEPAFDAFEKLASAWPAGEGELFRLKTSMDQFVSPLGRAPSVGGFGITATTGDGKFRYIPTAFTIFGTDYLLDTYSGRILPGMAPTPGALGIYVARARVGRMFTHDSPFEGVKIAAPDSTSFAALALSEYGQTLMNC